MNNFDGSDDVTDDLEAIRSRCYLFYYDPSQFNHILESGTINVDTNL